LDVRGGRGEGHGAVGAEPGNRIEDSENVIALVVDLVGQVEGVASGVNRGPQVDGHRVFVSLVSLPRAMRRSNQSWAKRKCGEWRKHASAGVPVAGGRGG